MVGAVLVVSGCGGEGSRSSDVSGEGEGEGESEGGGDETGESAGPQRLDVLPDGDDPCEGRVACEASEECPGELPHCVGPIEGLEGGCARYCSDECVTKGNPTCFDDAGCCDGLVCDGFRCADPGTSACAYPVCYSSLAECTSECLDDEFCFVQVDSGSCQQCSYVGCGVLSCLECPEGETCSDYLEGECIPD